MNTTHLFALTLLCTLFFQLASAQVDRLSIEQVSLQDGQVSVTFTGGQEPYSSEWTGPEGMIIQDASLPLWIPGAYCLKISDAQCRTCDTCVVVQAQTADNRSQEAEIFSMHEPSALRASENTQKQSSNQFELFPNPSDGKVTIKVVLMHDIAVILDVVDLQGKHKMRLRHDCSAGETLLGLDLADYPEGEYLISFRNSQEAYLGHLTCVIAH